MRNISNRTGNTQNKMKEVQYNFSSPREFLAGKSLMNTLGKAEAEEVFEKILRFSWKADLWVAPSLEEFDSLVNDEWEQVKRSNGISYRNSKKRFAYEKKAKRWNWLLKIFGREIEKPVYEEEIPCPRTFLTINPDAMITGFKFMKANGFIEVIDEDNTKYLKLTTKALDTLK